MRRMPSLVLTTGDMRGKLALRPVEGPLTSAIDPRRRWKQAEDLCAYFLKSTLPKLEAGPEKQRLLVRALKCRCRVRMRSSDFR